MTSYRFVIRNLTIELSEPTQEAFEKFWDTMFLNVFLEGLKPQIKKDLQTLIDTETYEVIEDVLE